MHNYELKEEIREKQKNMTLISIVEAKTRLAEYNVLLKYMSFLQKNGLSDCGRGQIMGQVSLLMEHLKEKEQQESKQWISDISDQQEEKPREKQQQIITKDAEKAGRFITAAFQENIVDNMSKSDLLRQVGNAIDKLKKQQ